MQELSPVTLPPKWEEPLYKSLARSIQDSIEHGRFKAGEQLPSQEEIARSASVNVRTVARAINLLIRDKVLVKRARGERARVALPQSADSATAPIEHGAHHRLRVTVQCVRTYGAIAEVSVMVQSGQQLVISTTTAAVEWLDLQEGQSATVDIKPSEIGVANTWM